MGNLLKGNEITADLDARAARIAAAAGDGWEVDHVGYSPKGDRAAVVVKAVTSEAIRDNAKNHTLMRAIDSGRDT